jgi:hypothetical protein
VFVHFWGALLRAKFNGNKNNGNAPPISRLNFHQRYCPSVKNPPKRVSQSDKRKRIAKQTIFPRVTLIAEQVAGNFRHFKATGNVDIVPGQRSVILQYRSQHRTAAPAPALFRLLDNRLDAQFG